MKLKLKHLKMNTATFIERAKIIHGDTYDYNKTYYTGIKNKLIIICKIHGEFFQTGDNHLQSNGCPQCGKVKASQSRIVDKEIILQKFKNVHGNTYDYSIAKIIDTRSKIQILCNNHGAFLQTPAKHIRGNGCPECGKIKSGKSKSERFINSKNKFITLFNEKYNYKYDYSLLELINPKIKVKIICPVHGIFEQKIDHHKVNGCEKCGLVIGQEKRKILPEDILNRFNKHHGNKYDYSKFVYKGIITKSIIICPKHGEFKQTPSAHGAGNGCKKCNNIGGYSWAYFSNDYKRNKRAHLYFIKLENNEEKFYKIGITTRKPRFRFYKNIKGYSVTHILDITNTLFNTFKCEQYLLHVMFKDDKYIPKNYFGGHLECFYFESDVEENKLNQIKEYMNNNNININI